MGSRWIAITIGAMRAKTLKQFVRCNRHRVSAIRVIMQPDWIVPTIKFATALLTVVGACLPFFKKSKFSVRTLKKI
jgi:hypothetical protein